MKTAEMFVFPAIQMPIHFPNHDLSIFTIPKNGGTTLWSWCYFVRRGALPDERIYRQTWMCDGPVLEKTLLIRRNPIGRFVSAYRNSRDKRGLNLPFNEFVRDFPNLVQQNADLLHHFRPQCSHVDGWKIDSFTEVLDFEDFELIKSRLEGLLECKLPDIHLQKSYFCDFTVTDEHVELIQQYYAEDYLAGFGDFET